MANIHGLQLNSFEGHIQMAEGGLAGQCLLSFLGSELKSLWGVLALPLMISMIWDMLLKSVSIFTSEKWD